MLPRLMLSTLSFSLLAASAPALAGAWTQAPGAAYVKIWNRTLVGRDVFRSTALGDIASLDEVYQDHQLQVYGEVGVAERLTWVGYVSPVGLAGYGDQLGVYVGPAWTGARVRLLDAGPAVLSVQATVGGRLPVGDTALFEGDLDGESVVVRPTFGTGQGDLSLQLGVGLGRWWVAVDAGARGFTSAQFRPAITGYAQVGWQVSERVTLDAHLPLYLSLGDLTELDVLGVTNTRYLGAGFTGSVWLTEHLAVTGSLEGVAFATSNAATPSLNIGVELR